MDRIKLVASGVWRVASNVNFKKTIILVYLCFRCLPIVQAQEMSDRDKHNQINYLFKMGTECYYQGKYSQAIKYWEAVLDIDPQQTQPPALIENARDQIQKESGPSYDKLKKTIEQGNFLDAQEYVLKLLDLDSSNTEYRDMLKKLKKIVQIFTATQKNPRVARLIAQSVYAYLIKPIDPDFAFLSIKQAAQLDSGNETIKKYYTVLKVDFPAQARVHDDIEGVNVIDQILQNSLNYIYSGQYVEAITECNRALKLDPENLLAMKRLGSAYFALGNKTQAYKIWEKALKFDPNDAELKKFIASK